MRIYGYNPAGDAGGALGAALSTASIIKKIEGAQVAETQQKAHSSPEFSDTEIEDELNACGTSMTNSLKAKYRPSGNCFANKKR